MQSTDCSKGPRGPIGSWDINEVTDMRNLFVEEENNAEKDTDTDHTAIPIPGADKFNGDLLKWDVLNVINMHSMFQFASSFNADLSKWDVSRVTNMRNMFKGASSFTQTLCGAWFASKANKEAMFEDSGRMFGVSSGQICRKTQTPTLTN